MMAGWRRGQASGGGRERSGGHRSRDQWARLVALVATALTLTTVPAAVWSGPTGLAQAQEEITASERPLPGQVIAQGIARLPRGEVAWTVRRVEVSGDVGTIVESYPVGFAIADDGSIALQDENNEILNILTPGQAAFLPSGKSGAVVGWEADTASFYEVALVSGRDVGAPEIPGTLAGEPFAVPDGAAFDIELARETLTRDEDASIPVSRPGTPVLFLQLAGSVQLEAGTGEIVELGIGQFAMLRGEVVARNTTGEPSTFVVTAIGEATAAQDAAEAGTPEARANREDRQRTRDESAQNQDAASTSGAREKRPKRDRTGGRAGGQGANQTVPQGTGDGTSTAPISGGIEAAMPPEAPAGTPAAEVTPEPTPPADTTAPADGTPSLDAPDDSAAGEETAVPEDEPPADTTVTPEITVPTETVVPTEETIEGDSVPNADAPPAEETPSVEEVPVGEEPVVEDETSDPSAGA